MRNFLRSSYVKVEPDIKKLRLKGDGIVAGELLEKMVFQAGTSTGYDALESPRKGKKKRRREMREKTDAVSRWRAAAGSSSSSSSYPERSSIIKSETIE